MTPLPGKIPVLGFAAFSGTGKTTLLEKVIPMLCKMDYRVGMIKHAHHQFDIDKPGKDSFRLRKAGASQMLIASDQRTALMIENETSQEPRLETLLSQLKQDELDLILVEGFKHVHFPKIELHRKELDKTLLYNEDDSIVAIATDDMSIEPDSIPVLDINNPGQIADFIKEQFLA